MYFLALIYKHHNQTDFYMAKIYSKRKLAKKPMLPKKETILLILQYSCALNIVNLGKLNFDIIAN